MALLDEIIPPPPPTLNGWAEIKIGLHTLVAICLFFSQRANVPPPCRLVAGIWQRGNGNMYRCHLSQHTPLIAYGQRDCMQPFFIP